MIPFAKPDPLPSERKLSINSVEGSGETQSGKGTLSVAAAKANLHYAETRVADLLEEYRKACELRAEALTAFNDALTEKHFPGWRAKLK
jgi:hypothetical protein